VLHGCYFGHLATLKIPYCAYSYFSSAVTGICTSLALDEEQKTSSWFYCRGGFCQSVLHTYLFSDHTRLPITGVKESCHSILQTDHEIVYITGWKLSRSSSIPYPNPVINTDRIKCTRPVNRFFLFLWFVLLLFRSLKMLVLIGPKTSFNLWWLPSLLQFCPTMATGELSRWWFLLAPLHSYVMSFQWFGSAFILCKSWSRSRYRHNVSGFTVVKIYYFQSK
jgi:hypothetical protein